MTRRVAVTGATGLVGRFTVPALHAAGFAVRALVRPGSDRSALPGSVEWVVGDLCEGCKRAQLVNGADALVHLAYAHVPGRYRGGEGADLAAWLQTNLSATVQLLLDARRASLRQVVFLSSRAVFSRTLPGRRLDEEHPTSPDSHYGAYKVAIEALLQSFAAVEGIATTSVRATGVYGLTQPVTASKWWDLVQAALCGEAIQSNRGSTEVHGDDLAAVIVALLRDPEAAPDLLHVSDLYVTHRQIVGIVQALTGRHGPLPPPPDAPMVNALDCPRLAALGISLGGERLLRATIAQLVDAGRKY